MIDDPFDLIRVIGKLLMLLVRLLLIIPELFIDVLLRSSFSKTEKRNTKRSSDSDPPDRR